MFLHIGKLSFREHIGRHVAILDAIIGKQGWCLSAAQIHMADAFKIQRGNGIVTAPQRAALVIIQRLKICFQFLRLSQKLRRRRNSKTVAV